MESTNKGSIDSWTAAERILEVGMGLSTIYSIIDPKNNAAKGVAVTAAILRILCAFIAPPKCTHCNTRMEFDQDSQYYVCKICGLIGNLK